MKIPSLIFMYGMPALLTLLFIPVMYMQAVHQAFSKNGNTMFFFAFFLLWTAGSVGSFFFGKKMKED